MRKLWPFRERGTRDRYWVSVALKVSAAMSLLVIAATLLVFLLTQGTMSGDRWLLSVSLGILGAALFFTYFLDRIVTKPVLSLAESATRMAQGDFSEAVPGAGRDEVGDLAQAMEELRTSFLAQKEDLEQLNAELDQKVREQTKELRDAQEQLIRTERLASVGRLAGGVAHEINNPTGVILTRAEYLMDTAEEEKLSDDALEDLDAIKRNAHRIARITASLLSFSRQTPVEMAAVNLAELTEEAVSLVSHPAKHASVEVVRKLEDLPPVRGDRGQLEQVLVNLMRNAIDAMSDPVWQKGSTDSGGVLTVNGVSRNGHVELTIQDTGPGLTAEAQDRLFEPFYTTKEVGKGTGLGLAIAYGIIADHDGEIRVKSQPGEGAAFTIVLPVWKEE